MSSPESQYIPILKVKRGEKSALSLLAPAIAQGITPLMEIVEKKDDVTVAAHLRNAFKGFGAALTRFPGYMLDTHELDPAGRIAARSVFTHATSLIVPFVPVVGLDRRSDTVDEAIGASKQGVAMRLTRLDLENARVPNGLLKFMAQRSLQPEKTDLLIDLGAVDGMLLPAVGRFATQFYSAIPQIQRWRTVTLIGCAFPKSMGDVDRNSHALAERTEWATWRDAFHSRRASLPRLPRFGDSAIQHPSGVEGFDPRYMKASAAVRYVTGDHWLLIKGVRTDLSAVTVQFPKLARSLVAGAHKSHFAGATHCAGCAGALQSANGTPGLGSPEAWRRLGTIHHLTLAVEQLRALSWP